MITLRLAAAMTVLIALTHARVNTARTRMATIKANGRDTGLGTLEMAILGLGLFLAATAVVLVVRAAINNRTAQIN